MSLTQQVCQRAMVGSWSLQSMYGRGSPLLECARLANDLCARLAAIGMQLLDKGLRNLLCETNECHRKISFELIEVATIRSRRSYHCSLD